MTAALKFWNGSSWVTAAGLKFWNGSTWTPAKGAYFWNGSAWTQFFSGNSVLPLTFTVNIGSSTVSTKGTVYYYGSSSGGASGAIGSFTPSAPSYLENTYNATVTRLYWYTPTGSSSGTPPYSVYLEVSDDSGSAPLNNANTFTSLALSGYTTLSRTSATYAAAGSTANWTWANVNISLPHSGTLSVTMS